ncbi:MAG: hypothetical protein ACLFNN_02625 [Candidatus Paceibacterota bacterium]
MAEENKQPSFIPKARGFERSKEKTSYSLFTLTGTSVFVLVLLVSASFFGYEYYLNSKIEQMEEELVPAEELFDSEFIRELNAADLMITSSEELMEKRVAPTEIFFILEDLTAENIYFYDFSYVSHKVEEGSQTLVELKAVAPSYEAIAFQSDVFREEEKISDVSVENIHLDEEDIKFDVILSLDEEVLLYKEKI